jgi:hypothetical protein
MTEREEQIQDHTEALRLPWIRPELHRLDAGSAELNHAPGADSSNFS